MPQPQRTTPAETKLVICVENPFPLWNPPADTGPRMRARFPEMRIVHLPDLNGVERELVDTDLFMGYALAANLLAFAPKLKWIHAVSAGVTQFMYPELRERRVILTNA